MWGGWGGGGGGGGERLDREIRIGDSTHSRRDPLALFVEGSFRYTHFTTPLRHRPECYMQGAGDRSTVYSNCLWRDPSDTHISPLLSATDRYAICGVRVTGPPFILIVCRVILPIHTFHRFSAPQTGLLYAGCG
jgi:hypothetical protein